MAQLELTFPEYIAVYNYVKTCFHRFRMTVAGWC